MFKKSYTKSSLIPKAVFQEEEAITQIEVTNRHLDIQVIKGYETYKYIGKRFAFSDVFDRRY